MPVEVYRVQTSGANTLRMTLRAYNPEDPSPMTIVSSVRVTVSLVAKHCCHHGQWGPAPIPCPHTTVPRKGNTATLSQTNVINFERATASGQGVGRGWSGGPQGHTKNTQRSRGQSSATCARAPAKWTAEHSPGWVTHMQQNDKHVPMCGEALQSRGDNHARNRKCSLMCCECITSATLVRVIPLGIPQAHRVHMQKTHTEKTHSSHPDWSSRGGEAANKNTEKVDRGAAVAVMEQCSAVQQGCKE